MKFWDVARVVLVWRGDWAEGGSFAPEVVLGVWFWELICVCVCVCVVKVFFYSLSFFVSHLEVRMAMGVFFFFCNHESGGMGVVRTMSIRSSYAYSQTSPVGT